MISRKIMTPVRMISLAMAGALTTGCASTTTRGHDFVYHYCGTIMEEDGVTPLTHARVVVRAGEISSVNQPMERELNRQYIVTGDGGKFSGDLTASRHDQAGNVPPPLDHISVFVFHGMGWEAFPIPLDAEDQSQAGPDERTIQIPPVTVE